MKAKNYLQNLGQTLAEFALILPVFIFLVVVIFDFGRAVYYLNALHNAAREGARYGSVNSITDPVTGYVTPDQAGIYSRVKTFAVGLDLSDSNITYAGIDPAYYEVVGIVTNPTIRVEVQYLFYPVTPFVSAIFPCKCSYITLKSDAVMRTEWMPKPLP